MHKILIFTLIMCLSLSTAAGAFEEINTEPQIVIGEAVSIDENILYLENLAYSYKDKYIVEKLQTADISAIEEFYKELSSRISLEELDSGKTKLDLSVVTDETLRKNLKAFKLFSGYSGIEAVFRPVCYYKIYRDVVLVGGYTDYRIWMPGYDDAYYIWVCAIENLTREFVPNPTRVKMLAGFKDLYDFMEQDKSQFKIFLLKDGKINSVCESENKQ